MLPGHSLYTLFTFLEVLEAVSSLDWLSTSLLAEIFYPGQTGDLAKWVMPSHL